MEFDFQDSYPSAKRKLFCNTCRTETNHVRRFGPEYRSIFDGCGGGTLYIYNLWACAGCDGITLEIMKSFGSIYCDFDDIFFESYLFPRRREMHAGRKTYKSLPKELQNAYSEIIFALNNDLSLLCSIGIRSLLESICNDRQAKGKNLAEKINSLKFELPENLVNNLNIFRNIGNDATHELIPSDVYLLKKTIEVLEDLMNYFYELEEKSYEIKTERSFTNLDVNDSDFDFEKNSYGDVE